MSADGGEPDEDARVLLAAFVLDHLGDEVTMTIETNSRKLIRWNDDQRRRHGLLPA
jgi:hypothetical protein